jgi:hypothetical protein
VKVEFGVFLPYGESTARSVLHQDPGRSSLVQMGVTQLLIYGEAVTSFRNIITSPL